MQCPRCEGTGQCSECHGQGFVTCVSCEGSGQRASSRGASYPCRNCKGTGKADCAAQCASCEGSGEITAALQAKVRDKYETRFDNTLPRTAVTNSIAFVCIFVYVLGAFNPDAGSWMYANLANISDRWNSEPWRLLSYALLHGGFIHLACNMSSLIWLGPALEGLYGSRRFLLILVITAICGGLASAFGHSEAAHISVSVGLSGSLFGLFGVLLGGYQRYRLYSWPQLRSLLLWIVVYSGVCLTWTTNIDHWCHLGGFLAGFAYAWFSRRPSGK